MNPFAPGLFADRVVLVTGAAGGVGGALAEVLAPLGARLVLTDRDVPALHERASALGATACAADLSKVAQIERLIAHTLQTHGRLDGLAHCAGIWVEGPSEEATEADWQRCMDVNLKATFFLNSRAIPALKATRGAIVNISSDAGVVGNAGAAIYCASKGGVGVMTKALARELAAHGVRVNALCPSDIFSPMLQFQAERYGAGDPQAYFQRLLEHYPQGAQARFLRPEEVAWHAAWLLSPACEGVTGSNALLDFGLTAGY
ncbi:SDR family oxidoreductase [Curvibacter sp. APW13]|uniref:SDR family NAD(P)-dependent oxidoreductase n=1 Tax=Curvibacter sp. APW13 TaxID=3077236 RepID=UPI0028DE85E6|nr:SDR family NAD(P)-dependent oxidoreductase [Curvibacter sp. APW13]MDT8991098.1 SDR family oxidoreductase [Curvibacter sp. APW13]